MLKDCLLGLKEGEEPNAEEGEASSTLERRMRGRGGRLFENEHRFGDRSDDDPGDEEGLQICELCHDVADEMYKTSTMKKWRVVGDT